MFLALVAAAGGALGVLDQRSSQAGDGEEIQLLVKCSREALPGVLRGLALQRASAWDLGTMKQLVGQAERAPGPPPTVRLPVADALRVMTEVVSALRGVHDAEGAEQVRLEELIVQERRVTLRCTVAEAATADAARRALGANAYLVSRLRDPQRGIEAGPQDQLPDGRWRVTLSAALREDVEGDPLPLSAPPGIPTSAVQEAAATVKMQLLYAGAERRDVHRSAGHMTIAREFTFAPARLEAFTLLLGRLATAGRGWTITEMRWKLADGKPEDGQPADLLERSVVMLALRVPYAD